MAILGDFPLGIAPLVSIAALTVPTVGNIIYGSTSKEDADESSAKYLVNAGAAIGLSVSLWNVSSNGSVPLMPAQWLFLGLWVLLCMQAISIFIQSDIVKRFQYGIVSAISCGIALLSYVYVALRLDLNVSDLPWPQILAALLQLVASLSLPHLSLRKIDGEHFVEEHAASVLSLFFFSWIRFFPEINKVEDLPEDPVSRRTRTIKDSFHRTAGTGALWRRLVRANRWQLLCQISMVLLKSVSQFGTRYALHQWLVRLEGVSGTAFEKWLCIIGLGAGLIADGVTSGWLTWFTHMWMASTTTCLLKCLLFEKLTRLQFQHELKEDTIRSTSETSDSSLSLVDLMENDTVSVSSSFSFWHPFPLAAFRVLFDMAYLTKLIGFKSVILGAAVSLSFLPLSAWLSKKHAKSQRDLTKEHAALFRIISEALPSLRQIRLSSMQVLWDRNILGARDAELSQLWTSNVALAFLKLASDLAPIMLSTVALSVFAYDNGGLKPSTAFAALSLLGNLHGVVRELPLMAANLRKSWISCRRIQRYLEQPEQVPLSVPGETIRVENVSAAWPTKSGCTSSTDVFQLRNLNLTFPNGELSIITGRTGSGKSLLLATLLEEAQLHDGRLLKPRATRPNKSTAVNPHTTTQTAVVTQPPWIDDCSIRDNILFGSHFDEARYHKVLRACALQQDIETLLERDITRAGRNGAMLSGGQKWRVALARALYSPADVLILEDVLSAVDAHVARWVYENALSGELVKGRTRILVTHQPEICRDLAKYYVIVQGGTASVHERTELRAPLATHNTNMPRNSGRQTPDIAGNTNTIAVKGNEMTERNKRSYPNIFAAYLAAVGGMHACIVGVLVTLACRISSSGHSWWLARWTAQPDARSSMTYYICIYMLLSVGDGVAIAIQSIVFSSIGIRASGALFRNAIQSLLHAPLSWIDRTSLGKVLQSFGDDMYWVDRRVSVELNGLLRTTVQLVFIIFTSVVSGPYTCILSPMLLGAFAITISEYLKRSKQLVRFIPAVLRPILEHSASTESGLRTIRAFGKSTMYRNRMEELLDTDLRLSRQVVLGQRWFHLRMGVLGAVFVVVTAAALVYNSIDAATAGLTIGLALQMKSTLSGIAGKIVTLQRAGAALGRILDLAAIPTESEKGAVPKGSWPSYGAISVSNLSARYNADLPVAIDDVSFTVKPGQRIGIIGRTGSGKTTLMNALLRFIDISSGEITVDGVDISKVRLEDLRKGITIIPQDPFMFSGTLRENLDITGTKSDEELLSILQRIHFSAEKDSKLGSKALSHALDSTITSGGKNISHGQRQLICLARALLAEPRILILDEATNLVDDSTDMAVQQIIREEFRNSTILVVAHKLSSVADFDSILVLDSGRVAEYGSPGQLLGQGNMFYEMVEQSGQAERIRSIIGEASNGQVDGVSVDTELS